MYVSGLGVDLQIIFSRTLIWKGLTSRMAHPLRGIYFSD